MNLITAESLWQRRDTERIIESGMCIGCGLCASLAGPDVLRMGPGPDGEVRPWAIGEIPGETQRLIRKVCPGVRMNLADPDPAAPIQDRIWGSAHRIAVGYASDPDTRYLGSSGGGISALTQYLLATQTVAFVLHVRASEPAPLLSTRQLSFDALDVIEGAGSRYGVSSPLADFDAVLARNEPFAVVGKPCDIAAVRNLAKIDPRVDQLVALTVSFLCGGIGAERLEYMLDKEHIDRTHIASFRCRGHGCPGPTHIEMADGSTRDYGFAEFWGDGEENWGIPFRCKVCPDAVGEQADIVAFDVFEGASPSGETAGYSGFIARSRMGAVVLEAAQATDYVSIEREMSLEELSETQPHHVRRRESAAPRLLAVALRNGLLTHTAWGRLFGLAARAGIRSFVANVFGALRRAHEEREHFVRGVPPDEWSGV